MARKVYCNNVHCKHHRRSDSCDTVVRLGLSGTCESFEKGFIYYVYLVWDALDKSNFIDFVTINLCPDLRIGIFYVCKLYHLIYSESEWATCRFLRFHKEENSPALHAKEIMEMEVDKAELLTLFDDFMAGNLPGPQKPVQKPVKDSQPYGWLSPTGIFSGSGSGTHEEAARTIIDTAGFRAECTAWEREETGRLCRDFLESVKGYVLIHNPSGSGGYIVSHTKPLTKHQREYLYDYFTEIGDRFKAEQYLEERNIG